MYDPAAHRDHPYEELRFGILDKAINDLKTDLKESIMQTEQRLCLRMDKVEQTVSGIPTTVK
jgi:hypothetical protein